LDGKGKNQKIVENQLIL